MANQAGFELLRREQDPVVYNVRVTDDGKLSGLQFMGDGASRWNRITLASVVFDGLLRITDAAEFRETLGCGIGTAKAYGFGLLSVTAATSAT
jgi:CRISPR system Cascade subunit CasE